jgi:UDP-GlcNAc:undecaprenyl-phosphate GlcNAc-1-phosphate transferase
MTYFWIALTAFVLTLILVKLAIRFFPKWGMVDRPHKYGLKRAPVPYYGGLIIVLSFMVGCGIFLKIDPRLLVFLLIGLAVAVISFIDDLKGISPYLRLLMQFLAGIGLYFSGTLVQAFPNPIGPEISLTGLMIGGVAILSLVVTVLWVVMIMNTLNWADGLNGLSSGVSAIAAWIIFLLSIKPGLHSVDQTAVAVMALILAVILTVFWFYEFYPARILMGDTGSMFVGFMLAGLAIYSGGKLGTAFLVLGFPILDAIWVILRRIFSKKSPFKGDLQHFHHRLLYAGLSTRQALSVIYLASIFFGILALVLGSGQKIWAMIGLLAAMAIIGFSVVIMEVEKSRKRG